MTTGSVRRTRVTLGFAVFAALAAALALLGRVSVYLDAFSHFAPFYVGIATVTLLLCPWTERGTRRWILAASGIALLASARLILPEFIRDTGPRAHANSPGAIKVVQLNALRTNADIDRIVDWLEAERPDVVTISEARHDLRDLLVRRMGWKVAGAKSNLMVFTPDRYIVMNRPKVGAQLTYVNASYRNRTGVTEVATTHLNWPISREFEGQVSGLQAMVAALPRERLILGGDFNATPWSDEMRTLDRALGLTRRDRAIPTWPAQLFGHDWPFPFLPIDHIYAGSGWATVKVERGPNVGSDHYPVVAVLAPVAPSRAPR